jgi:hypothetical protein
MAERQSGGFKYQAEVISRFGLEKVKGYTAHWDAYYKGIPVSIKHEKKKSDVEMADFFRQSEVEEDFFLVCGFWEGTKDNIVEEYILYIPAKDWTKNFDKSFSPRFKQLLEEITNDKSDDKKWRTQIKSLKKEWESMTSNLIRPRFKRDHKKQKRIQCAINNGDFYTHFIPLYEVKNFERNN